MIKSKSKKEKIYKIFTHLILITGAVAMLFPFFWMVSTSMKTPSEVLQMPPTLFPESFHWENYTHAWKNPNVYFGRYFLNTIFVAITTTTGLLFFSSLAAYAFSFFKFKWKNNIFLFLLATMMVPQQALLVPDYIILHRMGLLNTYAALIIPWLCTAFSIFLLRQFFMSIPKELYEASIIDGATPFTFYRKILLPLSLPPLLTAGMFSFLGSWNSFIWPLIVTQSSDLRVIQVGLAQFMQAEGTNWGPLMAASTFCTAPLIIAYFFVQKRFIQGIATTGMKD
ncbi:MAG: carbohydrate ABC transporter permease [Candidatus Muiribacteriota bacterium]